MGNNLKRLTEVSFYRVHVLAILNVAETLDERPAVTVLAARLSALDTVTA